MGEENQIQHRKSPPPHIEYLNSKPKLGEGPILTCRRGVALATVLALGALLAVLTMAVVACVLPHYRAHNFEQDQIQAYWNARAGAEAYLAGTVHLPAEKSSLKVGSCTLTREPGRLVFEGRSGRARERVVLREAQP